MLLIVEAAVQFIERDHDVFSVGGPFLKSAISRLDVRYRRPLYVDLEITVQRGSRRDIRQGQVITAQKRAIGENAVEQLEMARAGPDLRVDRGHQRRSVRRVACRACRQ